MSKKWITDGIDNNGWTWIAAEKGDTRGLILNAADADRVVCLLRAMDGVDDPAAFVAEAHRLAATVGAAMSCGTLTIDARWRIHRAIQSFSDTKETK